MSKSCFVIMSFDPKYDPVYHQAILPSTRRHGYVCERADSDPGPANIPSRIVTAIIAADLIIADLSEPNPNVYYELALSHCVGNKTIVITSNLDSISFDIASFRATKYRIDHDGLDYLQLRLEHLIGDMESRGTQAGPNNLVQEAGRHYFDQRTKIGLALKELEDMRDRLDRLQEFLNLYPQLQDNSEVADKLVRHIQRFLAGAQRPLLVSIAGPGAIGKSTFANVVRELLVSTSSPRCTADILPTDSYQLERAERISRNLIGFDPNAHDLAQLAKDVEMLIGRRPVTVRPYDHRTGRRGDERTVEPSDVLILEGVHAFCPLIAPLRGLRIFIDASEQEAKQLKFVADIRDRNYDAFQAFSHSDAEYEAYDKYVRPMLRFADFVVRVRAYWKYDGPFPGEYHVPWGPIV